MGRLTRPVERTVAPAAAGSSYLLAHPSADLYGSDRVLLESVEGFVRAGAHVTVTVPADGPLVPLLEERGADVVFTPTLVLRKSLLTPRGLVALVSQTVAGLRAGRRLIREVRPNVVWTNTITIPLWTVLARLFRIPSVVHVHEAEGSASRVMMRALALPLLLADQLVANSNYSAGVLRDSFARLGDRCTVVYNGVIGPETVSMPRDTLEDELRVLYVGRLSPRKGPDLVIEAIAALRERGIPARLDLIGAVFPGYEWFEQELRDSIATHDLRDRVRLRGFQNSPWPFLAASDVLVVPSRLDEPFGNTAVESVLAARPVVVSDTSGLREAAWGYRSAQQVEPGDARDIADALERVWNDWARFRSEAISDEAVARERHSVSTYQHCIADAAAAVGVGRRSRARAHG
ncbi:glycosyltransferase [Labedella populi]|uniref:Glycosyltransferase n=1 Tax=Labedella populi TaxID=2498850 RepID=A0A444Q730_9MICO|nr:glycosyltransferase [Labedella populi]